MEVKTDHSLVQIDNESSKEGCYLAWKDLTVKTKAKESTKILNSISGYIESGNLLFIMGPSGSGKSTLLDCLADRIGLTVDGTQVLNGDVKTPKRLKTVAKYVQQTDDMLGVLTVRETLQNSASFYISDPTKRNPAVESVLQILGLVDYQNTKIGNALVRGLSGGQRRRVSIGSELVGSPKILFLDEPTSGLDSATSYHVVKELKRIAAEKNIAMVLTIHQPSAAVYELADNLLLLSSGRTAYFGDARAAGQYFKGLGFSKPERSSDIEWILDLVNVDFGNKSEIDTILDSWKSSKEYSALDKTLDELSANKGSMEAEEKSKTSDTLEYEVSILQQISVLTKRGILNTIRNPAILWLRFAMYLCLSILIGAVWLRLGTSASVIIDTNNCLFYICAFMVFMSVSVLPAYLEERSVFVRERANGTYSVAAYIISHTIYEVPYVLCLAIMASCVTYWMVGLTPTAARFFVFVGNLFLSLFVAESMMVLIAALIPILIVGIAAGAMINGAFMCVMGAFVSIDKIGWWLRWLKFAALHFYSYSTFMVNQFRDTTWAASPTSFPPYLTDVQGKEVYTAQGLEPRIWVNTLVLISMAIVYRAMAAVWMQRFVRGKK